MTGWYDGDEPLPVPMLRPPPLGGPRPATLEEAIAITDYAQADIDNVKPACGIEGCDWPLVTCGLSKLPGEATVAATADRDIGLRCPATILAVHLIRDLGW